MIALRKDNLKKDNSDNEKLKNRSRNMDNFENRGILQGKYLKKDRSEKDTSENWQF